MQRELEDAHASLTADDLFALAQSLYRVADRMKRGEVYPVGSISWNGQTLRADVRFEEAARVP